ncbi:amidohydrolase family protein [Pelagibius sp. Alg239-R121]|uniref:N-acyl-D-amino-acid deacylase family protein n=1 Tax=Pelagibius sp. Alg239-R121 TaxID=2993448 RepID=UPI0024A66A71|nr:D-aminoacylase [Pelagibius sp. Alg239-R121]
MTENTTGVQAQQHDIIIRNARVIDGSGEPSFTGDLAILDDRISALGDLSKDRGASEIDAGGKVLAPGFIDSHTHDDHALVATPSMDFKISQGVTTVVTGNCGVSIAPLAIDRRPPPPIDLLSGDPRNFHATFAGYLDALDAEPAAVNAVCQVGHSTLRLAAMERLDRTATGDEIDAMRTTLAESMEAGAAGFSTGLFYPPARAAATEEVIEILEGFSDFGAIHTTHMRDEADHIADSIAETARIGREAKIPVLISHHKCVGRNNHGRSGETLAAIDQARATQLLTLDAYPYVAGSTMLDAGRLMTASKVLVTWSVPHPNYSGWDLEDVAKDMGRSVDDTIEALLPAGGIFFSMDEEDVRKILAYPHTMIGSDGIPGDEHPHPRLWGTFPRVLGHYSRDEGLFDLETAVRKMTSMTAEQFKLKDRGTIRLGAFADLVLFDAETIEDSATFEHPKTPARGIDRVFVNGRLVWSDGGFTGARPGRALRHRH